MTTGLAQADLDSLTARVIAVVAKSEGRAPETISAVNTFEELGIDSLDQANLVFALEDEFHISIPDEQAQKIKSIMDVVSTIQKLQCSA